MGFELDKASLWNVGSIPARGQYFFRLRVVKTRISKLASESRLWLGVETHPFSHPQTRYKLYYAQSLCKSGLFGESMKVSCQIENPKLQTQVLKLQAAIKYGEEDLAGAQGLVEQVRHFTKPMFEFFVWFLEGVVG